MSDGYGGGGPAYGAPTSGYPAPQQNNGLAIASLVIGILALLGVCGLGFGGLLGIVAIVLGVMARRKVKLGQAGQGGLALGGIITGAIALVLGIVVIVAIFGLGLWGQKLVESCSTLPADQQQACITSQVSSRLSGG